MRGDVELFEHLVAHGADASKSIALHRVAECRDAQLTTKMIVHLIENHKFAVDADDKCGNLRWFYDLATPTSTSTRSRSRLR